MVHIYGHTWPVRWGEENEPKSVKVYSNCDEIELFLNGKSLGMRRRNVNDFPAAGLRWQVVFEKGMNRLRAVGRVGEHRLSDEIEQEYQTEPWGEEASIRLKITELGEDLIQADALLVDAQGVPCLDSRKPICFSLAGDGTLLENLGTRTGSREAQAANGRASIQIRLNRGSSVLAARCLGLRTSFIEIGHES
ncbi:MAG: DUF4982 domain-containing protein, partial [Kiritimatiellia bacterium]|nr:DUF4982 domain-containing protein [Kiritimatiellia bacterium]